MRFRAFQGFRSPRNSVLYFSRFGLGGSTLHL